MTQQFGTVVRTNFSMMAAAQYQKSSDSINTKTKRDVRSKSLKSILQESFFHGASWQGSNFIL